MDVFAKVVLSLLAAPSLVLGYTYAILAVSLGFAGDIGFGGNVLTARFYQQPYPWHAWLRLAVLTGAGGFLAGFYLSWWTLFGVAFAAAVATVFLIFSTDIYTTTIGHGIVFSPFAGEVTYYHELVHIRQYEDLCLLGGLIGLILWLATDVTWIEGLAIWASSGAAWLLPNFLTAGIRYLRRGTSFMDAVYRGSTHEQAAYAIQYKKYGY